MPLPSGTRLGPYEIQSPVAAGGMGEVYKARDTRLDRSVAIKVLPPEVSADLDRRARFEREAKTVAGLEHPHICTLYDVGEHDGSLYLVMELLDGEPLRARLSQGPAGLPAVVDIGVQLADALESAHAKGIVHRDIKPENIFITARGAAKLLDFGIAKLVGEQPAEMATIAATRLGPGSAVLGTVGYMSPEQARGAALDARSDLFSLGAVLYEMATGCRAFPGETSAVVFDGILNRDPAWPSQPAVSPDLQRIISKALEKDREARYQSARELLIDLQRLNRDVNVGRPPAAAPRARRKVARPAWVAAAAAVVLLGALSVYLYFGRGEAIDSIAVLPFVNVSGDPNTEYLSDGISENLINSLTPLPNLRVVPRSMAFRYKGKEVDAQKAGKALKVRSILMGRVVQRGDSLNVQAELVDVRKVSQLWGAQYTRRLADTQTVQEEIGREIAGALRLKLTGEQQKSLARHQTQNSEAYQDYLKGRYYWNRRTAAGIRTGLGYFNAAVAKDPTFALAHAGVAQVYAVMSMNAMPARDAAPKAKAAALRALEIDPTLGEARAVLGKVKELYDFDWAGATGDFDKAIELTPGFATARQWRAENFLLRGRIDEALAEIKRAETLDPLSLMINAIHGWLLLQARRYDEAIEQLRQTLALDPSFSYAHFVRGRAYMAKQMYPEAMAEFQAGAEIGSVSGRGLVYAVTGREGEARGVVNDLLARTKTGYVPAPMIAALYMALGERDRAFEWLGKAVEEGGENVVWLGTDPLFDPLRSDPRFGDVLHRLNLVP